MIQNDTYMMPNDNTLAGQCATSAPALKMIQETADIYSSRCFRIFAAVLVNMSWRRALASNVPWLPFSPDSPSSPHSTSGHLDHLSRGLGVLGRA